MEQEIYRQLIQFGGATAVIVALIYLLREIGKLWQARNGNGLARRLKDIEENEIAHLHQLVRKVDEIDARLRIVERDTAVLKAKQ